MTAAQPVPEVGVPEVGLAAGRPARLGASTRELRLSLARSAARAGDLDAAERLLLASRNDPVELDLLARVCAQRGALAEAEACWSRVRAIDPDDPAAAAGLRAVAKLRAGRRSARVRRAATTALAGVRPAGGIRTRFAKRGAP